MSAPAARSRSVAAKNATWPFSAIVGWLPVTENRRDILVAVVEHNEIGALEDNEPSVAADAGVTVPPVSPPASGLSSVTCCPALSSTYTSLSLSASAGTSWEYVVKATNRPSALTDADGGSWLERWASRCSTVSMTPRASERTAVFIAQVLTRPSGLRASRAWSRTCHRGGRWR